MPIEVVCPRCAAHYEVADEKAGKKGRCPTCGGLIHVPRLSEAGASYHPSRSNHTSHMYAWIAASVAAAVCVVAVVLVMGSESNKPAGPAPKATANVAPDNSRPVSQAQNAAPEPVPAQLSKADVDRRAFLIRFAKDKLNNYMELLASEKVLRARDVLRKTQDYEPVQPEEYKLRQAVLDEAKALAAAGKPQDWHLDVPLSDSERRDMKELAGRVVAASDDMAEELTRLGLRGAFETDPFGRKLLDASDAESQLNRLQNQLPKTGN